MKPAAALGSFLAGVLVFTACFSQGLSLKDPAPDTAPASPAPLAAPGPDEVLVTVGGEDVSVAQYREAVLRKVGRSFLNDYANERLVRQEARRQGLETTPEEVEAWVARQAAAIVEQEGFAGDWAALDVALARKGYTRAHMYDELRSTAEFPILAERLIRRWRQTEEALAQAWRLEFGPRVEVRRIHLAGPRGDAGVLRRAEALRAKLDAGADFAKVAQQEGEGPEAASGGALGPLPRGALAPVLEEAVWSLEAGQLAGPISTDRGYDILQVVARVPEQAPLEEVRGRLQEALEARAVSQDDLEALVRRLRAPGSVEFRLAGGAGR
ncbi:MAG: peptidylprolyl isomerase [Planctomycetes bacterium]|nr:peptidylprolyl isomerase [Planctomycetota bacterium]